MGTLCLDYNTGKLIMVNLQNTKPKLKKSKERKLQDNCVISEALEGDYCNVLASRNIIFPPLSGNKFCLPGPKVAKQCIFEPTMVDPALIFAKTLSPSDGMVRCRVVNTAENFIQVFLGTPIGALQELPVKRIHDVNLNDIVSNDQSSDLVSKIELSESALSEEEQQKFNAFLKTKRRAFAKHDYDFGRVTGVTGRVCDTRYVQPIPGAPY